MTDWELRSGVFFRSEQDHFRVASAEEVYDAFIRDAGRDVGTSTNAPTLKFSRYPADLRLRLFSEDRSLRLMVSAELRMDGLVVGRPSHEQLMAGHAVLNEVWYPISEPDAVAVRDLLAGTEVSVPGFISLRQYLELIRAGRGLNVLLDEVAKEDFRQSGRIEGINAHGQVSGPVELYPYQSDGVNWLRCLYGERLGGILADEMGLGKTLQVITLLADRDSNAGPVLVVGTTSILENWRRELARFAPKTRVLVHHGSSRTGFPAVLKKFDVVVTGYDTLSRDSSLLGMIDWDVVVLDEAQAIKNPATSRARSAKALRRRVSLAVTGTPMENRLRDLWSLLDFAIPGYLGTEAEFERIFEARPDGARELAHLTAPLILRRRVAEVAQDLPPRIEIPQALTFSSEEAQLYEQLRSDIVGSGAQVTLALITKLRMFCAHPSLAGFDGVESLKLERLCEILEEVVAYRQKAIVFTGFSGMIDILTELIPRQIGVGAVSIDGRTKIADRQDIVDRFTDDPQLGVLVLNPHAAGVGLNITAATHVVHYSLEWNPAVEDQASARAYRRGQTRPVSIHRLYYAQSVEEVMNERLASKRTLAEEAVTGTDGARDGYADLMRAIAASPIGGAA